MEKVITIDGRPVPFKSTGAFLLRYKAQFRRDAIKDLVKLEPVFKKMEEKQAAATAEEKEAMAIEIFDVLDLDLFYNMAWVMAKTADRTILDPMEWLDSFNEFPVIDIMMELMDLLTASIKVSKKN